MTTGVHLSFDETLARRLPLPLAQLYRRAHNAKTALERHQTAYYLWEASVKLLASAAIVEFAESGVEDADLTRRLQNLARPSMGHWWEFVRRLVPLLAETSRGDVGYRKIRELVLGKARDDLPRASGLDGSLCRALDLGGGARTTVRLSELFDRLVQYRNREFGHGAAGQRSAGFYEEMSQTLLAGVAEILGELDPLAGRVMVFVSDVRRQAAGSWLVERYELAGETARRLETLELDADAREGLPHPSRVYLQRRERSEDGALRLRSLHPLVLFDPDHGEFLFLGARRGQKGCEYLSYSSGRVVRHDDLGREHRELLANILGVSVGESDAAHWAARSHAEDTVAARETPVEPGRRIGEFEVLSRIGRGGMGVVYRAWQPSLSRQVALKCLLSAGDPKVETRFAREIRSLGRVEHPGLVKIYTSGSDGDQWFYAMELIEGADLARVTDQLTGSKASEIGASDWERAVSSACTAARASEEAVSPSPDEATMAEPSHARLESTVGLPRPASGAPTGREVVENVVDIVRQVAEAAHVLHEAGVIHRDIKPGNIMVTAERNEAVLMDLGLAQLADDAQGRLTRTRQFVGTLRYASPEQVLAAATLDRRSDVYSLGATLWELLTLRPLFGAGEATPTPDLMLKIQSQEPERPSRHHPRIPPDLDSIVLKCLEKDPSRRYDSARGLAEDLTRWQRGEPVLAQPQTLRYVLSKLTRRYRVRIGVAALLVFGFLTLAVISTVRIHRAHERSQLTLFDHYTSSGLAAAEEGDMSQAFLWYASAATVPHGDVHRDAAGRVRLKASLARITVPVRVFTQDGENVDALEMHPDGSLLLTRDEDGRCRVWSVDDEREVELPCLERTATVARWSPDGEWLVLGRADGKVEIRAVPSGRELHSLRAGEGPVRALEFGAAGKFLAIGAEDLRIWNCEEPEFFGEPIDHPAPVDSLSFSLDGDRLVTACEDDRARVFVLDGDAFRPASELGPVMHWVRFNIPGLNRSEKSWRPVLVNGGRELLTVTSPTEVTWWNVETGDVKRTIPTPVRLDSLELSPDGRFLAIVDARRVALWNVESGHQEAEPIGAGGHVTWTADSSGLFHGSTRPFVREWNLLMELSHGRQRGLGRLLQGAMLPVSDAVTVLTISANGRFLVTAESNGLVRMWSLDLAGGRGFPHPVHSDFVSSRVGAGLEAGHSFRVRGFHLRPLRTTRVYDERRGIPLGPVLETAAPLEDGGFSPSADRVHTISHGTRGGRILEIWDWRSGERLSRAILPAPARAFTYSEQNTRVTFLLRNGRVVTVDWRTGDVTSDVARPEGTGFAFSPTDQQLVVWGPDAPSFWNTTTGERASFQLQERLECRELHFVDGRIITVTPSNTVHIWDETTGGRLGPPLAHERTVKRVALRGDRLLTWNGDQVSLWDLQNGRLMQVTPLRGSPAFLDNCVWFTTRAKDAGIWVWDAASGTRLLQINPASPDTPTMFVHAIERHAASPLPQVEPARQIELAEVLSGRTLRRGVISELSAVDWTARWKRIRQELPELFALRRSRAARNVWHRERLVEQDRRLMWNAAAWHLSQLGAAQTEDDRERQVRILSYVRSWRFTREARFWKLAYEEARRESMPWRVQTISISLEALDDSALEEIIQEARHANLARSRGPFVNFAAQYPRSLAISLGYCLRIVRTREARAVRILAGSDDTLRLWLNSTEIFRADALGPAVLDYHRIDLDLPAGENVLLVEVGQSGGDWGLFLRLEDLDGKRLYLNDEGHLETLE